MAAQGAPAAEASPNKKKKLIVILAAALLLAGGGGGGAWYYLKSKAAAEELAQAEEQDDTPKQSAKKKKKGKKNAKTAVEFVNIDPWFTVNLMDRDPERFAQVGLVLEISDKSLGDELKAKMPVIRSKILYLLSGKHAQDLASPDGKKKLAEEILAAVRQPLADGEDAAVENVHYSMFVVQ